MNTKHTSYTKNMLILIFALMANLDPTHAAATEKAKIDPADIKLVNTDPLPSKTNRDIGHERIVKPNEPDAVSERIAQSLLSQLGERGPQGKELANGLLECSAIHAVNMRHKESACREGESDEYDTSCLIKHGIGRKSIGQILTADRYDLNDDGVGDYIISDRYYCQNLSANQSNVYFVMLSQPNGDYRLAYADWASFGLSVVKDPKSGKNVLMEIATKNYGVFTRIMQLANDKYVPRICIVEDQGKYSRCDEK